MKILITGGNGQVAHDLKKIFSVTQHTIFSPDSDEMNVIDFENVCDIVENFKPDFIINTAAYTKVDQAEQEVEKAFATNAYGAKHMAIASKKFKCPLIQLSTDYVFDGKKTQPYIETDLISPLNVYGKSKSMGEDVIQEYGDQSIILRVSAVFGVHGNNFVKTVLRLAREKEMIRIVSDQITCPTPAIQIASALFKFCENPLWGIYHFCGAKAVSWYEFATSIIAIAKKHEDLKVKKIEAITTKEYPTPAKRPRYSVLNCDKILSLLGIQQPDWEKELADVISHLYTA